MQKSSQHFQWQWIRDTETRMAPAPVFMGWKAYLLHGTKRFNFFSGSELDPRFKQSRILRSWRIKILKGDPIILKSDYLTHSQMYSVFNECKKLQVVQNGPHLLERLAEYQKVAGIVSMEDSWVPNHPHDDQLWVLILSCCRYLSSVHHQFPLICLSNINLNGISIQIHCLVTFIFVLVFDGPDGDSRHVDPVSFFFTAFLASSRRLCKAISKFSLSPHFSNHSVSFSTWTTQKHLPLFLAESPDRTPPHFEMPTPPFPALLL